MQLKVASNDNKKYNLLDQTQLLFLLAPVSSYLCFPSQPADLSEQEEGRYLKHQPADVSKMSPQLSEGVSLILSSSGVDESKRTFSFMILSSAFSYF